MTAAEPRDGLVEVLAAHAWQAAFGGCHEPCGWQSSEGPTEQDEHAAHVAQQVREWLAGEVAAAEKRGAERALEPFRELFAGGPDTVCRTTWRDHPPFGCHDTTECTEVPMADLRAAFDRAEQVTP